jgi:hypothetical protein
VENISSDSVWKEYNGYIEGKHMFYNSILYRYGHGCVGLRIWEAVRCSLSLSDTSTHVKARGLYVLRV